MKRWARDDSESAKATWREQMASAIFTGQHASDVLCEKLLRPLGGMHTRRTEYKDKQLGLGEWFLATENALKKDFNVKAEDKTYPEFPVEIKIGDEVITLEEGQFKNMQPDVKDRQTAAGTSH